MSKKITISSKKMLDSIKQIENDYRNKAWKKCLSECTAYVNKIYIDKEYLNGLDPEILAIYARCLIEQGSRKKGKKLAHEIEKWYIKFENIESVPREGANLEQLRETRKMIPEASEINFEDIKLYIILIMIRAQCGEANVVKRIINILEKNRDMFLEALKLSVDHKTLGEFYFEVAEACRLTGKISLGMELYDKAAEHSVSEDIKNRAQNNKRRLEMQLQFPQEFRECYYHHYISKGNKLKPGDVIVARKIDIPKTTYSGCAKNSNMQNTDSEAARVNQHTPIVVWKIEEDKIFGFPLTINDGISKGHNTYVLSRDNYPLRDKNREFKDRIYSLSLYDVEKVIDRIKPDDYLGSLNAIYDRVVHDQKGVFDDEHKPFMDEMLNNRKISVGKVIIASCLPEQDEIKHYLIVGIDSELGVYKAVAVDSGHRALSTTIEVLDIEKTQVKAILPACNQPTKEALLRQANILRQDGNVQGITFEYKGKRLEIMKEISGWYICQDITESLYSNNPKIIIIPRPEDADITRELDVIDRTEKPKVLKRLPKFNLYYKARCQIIKTNQHTGILYLGKRKEAKRVKVLVRR